MTRIGDDSRTTGGSFASGRDMALHLIAMQLYTMSKSPADIIDAQAWLTRVETSRQLMEKSYRVQGRHHARTMSKAERKKTLNHIESTWAQMQLAHRDIVRELKDIARLPAPEQREQLQSLWRNWVEPRMTLHGEVPGKDLTAPDWQAARGLVTASSEPTVLRLETAFERGRFERDPALSDWPIAPVSGMVGQAHVTAHAELTPLPHEAGADAQALMAQLAERMRDPLEALGPKTAQALQALLAAWLAKRDADQMLTIHISQLADDLGYARRSTGDHHADTYKAIREYIDGLQRVRVHVSDLPALKGKTKESRFHEPAFYFGFHDDPDEPWTVLKFRPNKLYSRAAARERTFLMGADPELNKLDTQHERTVLLLGKYLEREFRKDYDNRGGSLKRRVQLLLTEGMGLSDADAATPRIATMRRLIDDLDRLEQRGTITHWEGDEAWQAVDALLAEQPGKRMTRLLWRRVLEASLTIDAGRKYHEHYAGFWLADQSKADPLIVELSQYIASSGRPQKLIAADLRISQAHLSYLRKGKRKLTPDLKARIEAMLAADRNLPLFPLE